MQFRRLGHTALTISPVSLGCSGFWGNRAFSEQRAHDIVWRAFERGINHFDTGHNYSNYNAEPRLGRVVAQLLQRYDRSRLIISSKAGTLTGRASVLRSAPAATDYSPDAIEASCLRSIQNLRCDYLDIFYLHGIGVANGELTDELLGRLDRMRRAGMFRSLGINTHTAADMPLIAQRANVIDVVLLDYNALQLDREPLMAQLHEAGVAVLAGTVLAQGHLVAGKVGRIRSLADAWYWARARFKPSSQRLASASELMRDVLTQIARELGWSPAQAAMTFVLSNPDVASCVFGTTRKENLDQMIDALDFELPLEAMKRIRMAYEATSVRVSS